MRIWRNEQKGDDKLVAFYNQTIYKANPKDVDIESYISQLSNNSIPTNKALEIPLGYLREVSMIEGKNYINVEFGSDSSEHFVINDHKTRFEVFEYLSTNLPVKTSLVKESKMRAARKPLIAMLVVALIFTWTLSLAIEIEKGNEFEVVGSQRSIANIILGLASLGVKNVALIFTVLMSIGVFAAIRKLKNPLTIHRLIVKR